MDFALIDVINKINKTPISHFKFAERRPSRQQNSFKIKLIFVSKESCCPIQIQIQKKPTALKK